MARNYQLATTVNCCFIKLLFYCVSFSKTELTLICSIIMVLNKRNAVRF